MGGLSQSERADLQFMFVRLLHRRMTAMLDSCFSMRAGGGLVKRFWFPSWLDECQPVANWAELENEVRRLTDQYRLSNPDKIREVATILWGKTVPMLDGDIE